MDDIIKQEKRAMKQVKEKYFGAPNQVRDHHTYTPFYQDIERIAKEEGMQFGDVLIREGMSGWSNNQVQPLICANKQSEVILYQNQNLEDAIEDLHTFMQAIPNYDARVRASRKVIVILEPAQFFINRDPQFRNLERKLREVYRIGYHIVEAEKDFEQRQKELWEKRRQEEEEFTLPFEDIKKYLIEQISGWKDRGLVDIKTIDHLTKSCLWYHRLFSDAFDKRRKQVDDEIDTEKKRIIVVPENYDPDIYRKIAEIARKDFLKRLKEGDCE
jgi:hypothetical protein